MNAQGEALLRLAHSRGLADPRKLQAANARAGDATAAAEALASLGVQAETIRALVREVVRGRFSCRRCSIDADYEKLLRLEKLACPRCRGPLELAGAPIVNSLDSSPRGETSRTRLAAKTKIGPYELVMVLGRGANGVVHLARREGLDRDFAVKVLSGAALADDEAVARFRREAQVASRLRHPSIVSVFDVGSEPGCHYYAMEFCRGSTFQKHLAENALEPLEAAKLLARIAAATAFAHEHDVVHRDLKPANIILDEAGHPRITDFGLALDNRDQKMTRTGDVLGTPLYMSPEQLQGEPVDGRADVWAIGVMLYEALTGQRPFEAKTGALLAYVVLTEELVPPRTRKPTVPPELDAICRKALAKKADDRYPTAKALAEDLERFVRGEAPSVRPETTFSLLWKKVLAARRIVAILAGAAAIVAAGAALSSRGGADRLRHRRELERFARELRIGEAAAVVSAARQEGPDAELELTWARCLVACGRAREARLTAAPLVAQPGVERRARVVLATALLRLNERAAALEALGEGRDDDPAARALALLIQGKARDAAPAARTALERDPGDALSALVGAIAFARGGALREATALVEAAERLAPADAQVPLVRAFVEHRSVDAKPAALRALLARSASLEASDADANAVASLLKGWLALVDQDLLSARAELEAAVALGELDEAPLLLAHVAGEIGDRALADRANAAFQGDARNAVLELVGRVAKPGAMKLSQEARIRFQELALAAKPEGRAALQSALAAAGEGSEAAHARFRAAAALAPSCPSVAFQRARFLVGRDRLDEAGRELERARSLGADSSEVERLDGERLWRSGQIAAAVARFKPLSERKDNEPGTLYARAALFLLREKPGALVTLQGYTKSKPADPDLHRLLAYTELIANVGIVNATIAARAKDSAQRALLLEGALDADSLFFADFAVAIQASFERQSDMAAGDVIEDLDRRTSALAPSPRYAFWIGRFLVKFTRAGVAAKFFARADERGPERRLGDLGRGIAILASSLGEIKARPASTASREAVARAAQHLRAAQREWIPREWLDHIEKVDEPLARELSKNQRLE